MATSSKLGFVTLLLLCGMIVMHANAQMRPCTKECDTRAEYQICPRASGESKVQQVGYLCTNCCTAENEGCILLDQSGTPFCQEEPSFSRKKIVTMV